MIFISFKCMMLLAPFLFFGSLESNEPSNGAKCPDATFVSISPTNLTAGNATRITVKFKNSGNCVWKKGTVKLYANSKGSPSGVEFTESIKRKFGLVDSFPGYLITQDIAVNATATFRFIVDAFPSPGKYSIKYRLVQKPGVTDFFGAYKDVEFTVK